jgi:ribosomal protein S12 methylthiotransferase accessory factor
VSWIAAAEVPERLTRDLQRQAGRERTVRSTEDLVSSVLAMRRRFGITRLGSLTRLDRAGVCVAQAVRPMSLSNAVSQGKGLLQIEAAASALMESLEAWAAETVPPERIATARAVDMPDGIRDLYAGCVVYGFDAGWDRLPLGWIEGYDLLADRVVPVPTALVDTAYTSPSPHPVAFPRSTTGLAAGTNLLAAILHAALEVLERASLAEAGRRPRSLPLRQVDLASVDGPLAAEMLERLAASDLVAGIWLVETEHDLPVFKCHVIEGDGHREIAPMPGEGFACDFTNDSALAKALMEAAQARVTALAGAREDITRLSYPESFDRAGLASWRAELLSSRDAIALPPEREAPESGLAALKTVLDALKSAGAKAAIVVPLYSDGDPELEVVRVIAPPLRDLSGR